MTWDCMIFTFGSIFLICWAVHSYYHSGVVARWAQKRFVRLLYRYVMFFLLGCSVLYVIISMISFVKKIW